MARRSITATWVISTLCLRQWVSRLYFETIPFRLTHSPATTQSSASAHTPSKRNRDDDESRSPPEPKKSKFLAADPVFTGDSQQAKLIIETDIAKIGDLSTW